MLSCLQVLCEEEMLLWVKTTLHKQLTCLKVEELALQSMFSPASGTWLQRTLRQMDDEAGVNQSKLQISLQDYEEEVEEK